MARQNETLHLELQQASAALAELRTRVGRQGASWRDGGGGSPLMARPIGSPPMSSAASPGGGSAQDTSGGGGGGGVGLADSGWGHSAMAAAAPPPGAAAAAAEPAARPVSAAASDYSVQSELDAVRQQLYSGCGADKPISRARAPRATPPLCTAFPTPNS